MIRYGVGMLIAASTCAAFGVAACGDNSVGSPPITMGGTGGGSAGTTSGNGGSNTAGMPGGGSAGTATSDVCTGACCPTDASCYSSSAGPNAPGAICMARHENTPDHIQLRQTWLDILTPKGNTIPAVLGILNTFTQLTEPACNTPTGGTGYMQAIDLDLNAKVATLGYVTYIKATDQPLADGLCFGDVGQGVDSAGTGWTDKATFNGATTDFSLPASQMSSSAGYPPGLPAPMPQPWKMGPTHAKIVDTDFSVATLADRTALLARFATGGDLQAGGFDGISYYDKTTGTSHGFSPVSFQLIYDNKAKATDAAPSSYILVPIREAELTYRVNDPAHPSCIGKYRPDLLDPSTSCADPNAWMTNPAWSGIYDTTLGEGDAHIQGYFLITELEQIYSSVLGQTLCVSYPTAATSIANGWATTADQRCRAGANSKKWNPSDGTNGLPMGDWCAKSNSAATPDCHDAYRSVSYHAFQGFKIKADHCKALPL